VGKKVGGQEVLQFSGKHCMIPTKFRQKVANLQQSYWRSKFQSCPLFSLKMEFYLLLQNFAFPEKNLSTKKIFQQPKIKQSENPGKCPFAPLPPPPQCFI